MRARYVPSGNNRVILATDGDFNVGVSGGSELVTLIERERIDDIGEARKALVEEMSGTLHTLGRDVKIQVEWDPARVAS